ncbi:MAG: ATP-binding protein [Candidatus Diapherotrites archaeon]|nr:ATP-binding protein [Candidatus Diapherotrites archaeon]
MTVEELLSQEESESLERKSSIADSKGIGETACAFANQPSGGFFLIGVDKAGNVVGVPSQKVDDWTQAVASIIQSARPVPKADFKIVENNAKKILVVQVHSVNDEYACFYHGKIYVRVGNTTRALNEKELIDFLRVRQILSFEETVSSVKLEDIENSKVQEYLKLRNEKISLNEKTALQNMGLLKGPNKETPTNLALLFFARKIEAVIPQSEIRLTRFKGVEPIHIANTQRLTATLIDAIEKTIGFIDLYTEKEVIIQLTRRTEKPTYPLEVIREAVINALGHRDYFNQNATQVSIFDDRVEITNPGSLPKGLPISQLGRLSVHRNPRLYQLLSHAKYGEGLGTGIPRMIERMRAWKLPDPKFEEIGNAFRVTLYNTKSTQKIKRLELTPLQEKILQLIRESKSTKTKTLTEKTNYSAPTIINNLNELEKRGLIKKIGKTRGAHYILRKGST